MAYPINFDFPKPFSIDDAGMYTDVLDMDNNPNHVLECGQPWKVVVKWFLKGPAVPYLGGKWHVTLLAESMGKSGPPDFEGEVMTPVHLMWEKGTLDLAKKEIHFELTIDIPPVDPVKHLHYLPAGIYKLVTAVTYENEFGKTLHMAGFAEHPVVQFYQPEG